jgi:hypothetical protein
MPKNLHSFSSVKVIKKITALPTQAYDEAKQTPVHMKFGCDDKWSMPLSSTYRR